MKIIDIKTSDLKPYERNNRKHPAQQIERIAASIKEFGFDQPVIIDADNVIIAGHGRWAAAKKLKMKEVPCVISTLEEVKARARRILDNKLQNDSEWDFENIPLELEYLVEEGFDLETWGLDELMPFDERDEWTGMPEFDQSDETPHRTIRVHFESDEAVKEFATLIKQRVTEKTKSIWHPAKKAENLKNIRVVAIESDISSVHNQ